MKAFISPKYGSPDVLNLQEIDKPGISHDQVLVKIEARSLNPFDWHFMRGKPVFMRAVSGLVKPKHTILGADIAGRIEAVGSSVKQFQPGEEVFGSISFGGFAEYVSAAENRFVLKPANITFEEAAAVPIAAISALQGLRDAGKITAGQKVLINGASGGVGTYAVQIAKTYGALVTGVCSTRNVELVRSLGADRVIDYTREDFSQNVGQYDLILDNVGNRSYSDLMRALSPQGRCVLIGYSLSLMVRASLPRKSKPGGKQLATLSAKLLQADLEFMSELLESGQVISVIDQRFSFNETPEAIRYLESGHARGKVVVVGDPDE